MLMSGRIISTIGKPPTPLSLDSDLKLSCHLWVCHLAYRWWGGGQGLVESDLSPWTYLILISLCYALGLCYYFKSCAMPPSLLLHALFLSHIWATVLPLQSWMGNQKIAGPWQGNAV